jgi:hypothetical protein
MASSFFIDAAHLGDVLRSKVLTIGDIVGFLAVTITF